MADLTGLHILIVPAWWPSPEQPTAGVFFRDYALAYADAGARVGVIYPDLVSLRYLGRSRVPVVPRVEREFLRDDIPVIRIRGFHTALGRPLLQMWRFRAWLSRGLEAYQSLHGKPDVVHAMCSIPAGWACATLKDELASRVVLTEHFGPFAAQMTAKTGESFVREAITKAAEVVTVSEHSREDMSRFGLGREIRVCGNPVGREFLSAESPALKRERPTRCLFVGRLTREKGVGELADAAAMLSQSRDTQWRWVGEGPLRTLIVDRFTAMGDGRRLALLGELSRERVVAEMLAADFLVLPSHGETFGTAVAEALCVGLPVVVSRNIASAEFVNASNGLQFESRNVSSLTETLRQMIDTARSYDRLAIASEARSKFSGRPVASFYADVFHRLLNHGS